MRIFKYKFTKLMTAFIYFGLVLSVAAAGVNTYYIIADGIKSAANPVYPIITYSLMYVVSILLFVILLSLLLSSYYSIDGQTFKTIFGIIKSKYDVKKIDSIVLDRETNKLSVFFNEHTFIIIAVKEEWYEDFINELLKANNKIEYTINSKENKPDDENKNKK